MTREEALKIWLPIIKQGVETMAELNQALDMAIKALEQTRWIPVSERLPEYGEAVITVNSDDDYEINHIIDDDLNEWFYDGIIAWMPLPELYKEEEE